jgi:hypothetical protein
VDGWRREGTALDWRERSRLCAGRAVWEELPVWEDVGTAIAEALRACRVEICRVGASLRPLFTLRGRVIGFVVVDGVEDFGIGRGGGRIDPETGGRLTLLEIVDALPSRLVCVFEILDARVGRVDVDVVALKDEMVLLRVGAFTGSRLGEPGLALAAGKRDSGLRRLASLELASPALSD